MKAPLILYAQLGLSAVAFSFTGPFLRLAAEAGSGFWPTLLIRSIMATAMMMLFTGRVPRLSAVPMLGAALMNTQFLIFAQAILLVNPGMVSILSYTSLLWIPLIVSVTGREKVTLLGIVTSVGLLFSSSLFFLDQLVFGEHLGLLLGLAAGFIWSLALVVSGKQDSDPPMSEFDVFILASIQLAFVAAATWIWQGSSFPPLEGFGWALAGAAQSAVALILLARPLRKLDATVLNMGLFVFDPTLATVWSALFFQKRPSFWALIGGVSIIVILLLHAIILLRRRDPPAVSADAPDIRPIPFS